MKINNHVVCKAVDEYVWLWLYVFMYGYVVPNKSVIVEKFWKINKRAARLLGTIQKLPTGT